MINIFHIISRLDVGGAERVAINIAMSQNRDYCHHIVELQRGHSRFTHELIAELKENGIQYHRSWMPIYLHLHCYVDRLVSILFPFRFLFLWLKYRPEIVHSHTEMPDMAAWLTLRLLPFIKIKIVRTIHNTQLWNGMHFIGPKVEHFMQQRNANIAISPNVQKAYQKHYGTLPPIIYNGIAPKKQQKYSGIIAGKTNILFAGRFEEQKGITVLCSIIKAMQNDKRYHFHIFGAGRLQCLIDCSLRDMDNVTIQAPMNGISSVMQSFDYLIMPSLHEGLSILAIEASMNGLPVIINNCAGLSDTLPEEWPLTVNNNNMEEWERIFNDILPQTDRKALVTMAQNHVKDHFSIEEMQKKYELLYADICPT